MASKSSNKDESFAVPSNLAARCMRLHGWSESYADKAIAAYLQFIKIKKHHEDWDASVLSPSLTVDLVWHQHILDPVHYAESCVNFAGQVIGHDPDGGLDQAAREQRITDTKFALRTVYGRSVDSEVVWCFGDNLKENGMASTKRQRITRENDEPSEASGALRFVPAEPNELITIRVRDRLENRSLRVSSFRIRMNTNLENVFISFAEEKGMQEASLRFLLDGERVYPGNTPATLNMDEDDFLDVLLEQAGC